MQQRRESRLRWYYKNRERAAKKHAEWIVANKEQQVAYVRAYDFEHREERKAKAALRRKTRPDKISEANRKSHAKHKVAYRQRNRAWKAANPDACVTHCNNRRARLLKAAGSHTVAEWRAILKAHGHRCAYCGLKQSLVGRLTRDHYVPLSKGGSNAASNIVPSCSPCNHRKWAKDPLHFAKEIGRLL